MPDPRHYLLSHLLTNLIGRTVTFTPVAPGPDTKGKHVYGIYTCSPSEAPLVVKADLSLLGSFAGALVGLPDSEVQSRLLAPVIEELFTDAMFEVLNVASSSIASEGRAILSKMVMDLGYLMGAARKIVVKPNHRVDFNVVVQDYHGGRFAVLS